MVLLYFIIPSPRLNDDKFGAVPVVGRQYSMYSTLPGSEETGNHSSN